MKISSIVARRRVAGISAGCLLGGMAMGIVGAPSAAAAPDCSPGGVNATVSSVTGRRQSSIWPHTRTPTRWSRPPTVSRVRRPQSSLRSYFTAHPQEYNDLRGILAPIGDTERQCNVTGAAAVSGVGVPRVHGRLILPTTTRHDAVAGRFVRCAFTAV